MATLTHTVPYRRRRASVLAALAALGRAILAADRHYRTRRALGRALGDPHLARDLGLPPDAPRDTFTGAARHPGYRPF